MKATDKTALEASRRAESERPPVDSIKINGIRYTLRQGADGSYWQKGQ